MHSPTHAYTTGYMGLTTKIHYHDYEPCNNNICWYGQQWPRKFMIMNHNMDIDMHEPTSWMPNLLLEHTRKKDIICNEPTFVFRFDRRHYQPSLFLLHLHHLEHQRWSMIDHNQLNSIYSSSSTSALCTNWNKQGFEVLKMATILPFPD